ncbi:MAG TPA: thioesterase family protein, partial [Polyangiaceae bacterium]|nr:thioesterase family protein [Polyangiaceae bacterium]
IRVGGLDVTESPVIGVVVESHCRYRESVAYPDLLRAGLRVDKLGNRSVTYGMGIFREARAQESDEACAHGYVTHVFVDRKTRRAVPIPEPIREALLTIV